MITMYYVSINYVTKLGASPLVDDYLLLSFSRMVTVVRDLHLLCNNHTTLQQPSANRHVVSLMEGVSTAFHILCEAYQHAVVI